MEQVRLCAVWPLENWLGSSSNQSQRWTTVQESYSHALEQGPLDLRLSAMSRNSCRMMSSMELLPKPKSRRCLMANLLCSFHSSPKVAITTQVKQMYRKLWFQWYRNHFTPYCNSFLNSQWGWCCHCKHVLLFCISGVGQIAVMTDHQVSSCHSVITSCSK